MQRSVGLHIGKFSELVETVRLYNVIVNIHVLKALEYKTVSKKKLHQVLYSEIRQQHPSFPSALVQCARDNAVEMLKSNKYKKCTHKKHEGSIRFDARTAKVFLVELSLTGNYFFV